MSDKNSKENNKNPENNQPPLKTQNSTDSEKINPQQQNECINNNKSQKSNTSFSNISDEKEIYNIRISIGNNSNSNSKNDSQDNLPCSKKPEEIISEENNINNNNINNNININDINNNININNCNNNINNNNCNNNINNNVINSKENEENEEIHPTEGPIGMSSAAKDPEEYRHLRGIVSAFFNYQIDSLRDVSRMERDFKAIGEKYIKRLSFNYNDRLDKLKHAIWQNYCFLVKIAEPYKNMFKLFKATTGEILMEPLIVEGKDIVKMRSTLRLFIRDWAINGIDERNQTYKPILSELKTYFKNKTKKEFQDGINVLVPGAGLGRLMYEIAKLGFKSQGNEFSYYMLLCSNFLFNNTTKENEYMIQPLIHSFSNIYNEDIPFTKVYIPDENLAEELSKTDTGEMSMVAGEFVRVYKDKLNYFDSVVTCFFIDTANNIIQYIETIYNIMKVGGLWINFGPLLYHYTDNEDEVSIELSWAEIKYIIKGYGFEIVKESEVETTYSANKLSMKQRVYKCIFFSAIKKN